MSTSLLAHGRLPGISRAPRELQAQAESHPGHPNSSKYARSITKDHRREHRREGRTGQYAEVNGINLYFETHGAGRPLILLHSGLGPGEMFGPILPLLAERHQVVGIDLQGHGRTADIETRR